MNNVGASAPYVTEVTRRPLEALHAASSHQLGLRETPPEMSSYWHEVPSSAQRNRATLPLVAKTTS
jgi:hypothetical protein